jgi:hypothetical protein
VRLLTVLAACVPLTALLLAGGATAGASSIRPSAGPYPLHFDYGYVDTNKAGNTYSEVSGHWVVPTLYCRHNGTSETAFWVGLDGYSNNSEEEAGVLVLCIASSLRMDTFYAIPGLTGPQIMGTSVTAGDKIRASVAVTGTTYKFKVTDANNPANSFSETKTCPAATCPDKSAEWMTGPGNLTYGMTRFRPWKLMSATVTSGSTTGVISTFPHQNRNNYASPLTSSGAGFTVKWSSLP